MAATPPFCSTVRTGPCTVPRLKAAVSCSPSAAELHGRAIEQFELENDLRRAVERGELELSYQPLMTIDGDLDGLEALLAWNHPKLGRIAPLNFIPIAEESGLIVPIGSWVIAEACLTGARWRTAGLKNVRISVNVSALQFARSDFVDSIATTLESTGFPAGCLELELTETFVLRDIEESARRMRRIRDLGAGIAIDDFGTGYSSLTYLRRLPVNSLKIDRSFLRDLVAPGGSPAVVQGIVLLAHSMGLAVVAEGVETVEELDLLRAAGCDKVQGHLYGEPLRESEARVLLARAGANVVPATGPKVKSKSPVTFAFLATLYSAIVNRRRKMKRLLFGGFLIFGVSYGAALTTYTTSGAYLAAIGSSQTFAFGQPDGTHISTLGSALSVSTQGGDPFGEVNGGALCGSTGASVDCFSPVLLTFLETSNAFGFDNGDLTTDEEAVVTFNFTNGDPAQTFAFNLAGQPAFTPTFFGVTSDVNISTVQVYSRTIGTTDVGERAEHHCRHHRSYVCNYIGHAGAFHAFEPRSRVGRDSRSTPAPLT